MCGGKIIVCIFVFAWSVCDCNLYSVRDSLCTIDCMYMYGSASICKIQNVSKWLLPACACICMHVHLLLAPCICVYVWKHFILHIAAFWLWSWIILFCFPGYTINIYVEMFHSEKQFDELEIFDGIQSFSFLFLLYIDTHTRLHTHILTCSFNSCLFIKSSPTVNKMHNTLFSFVVLEISPPGVPSQLF